MLNGWKLSSAEPKTVLTQSCNFKDCDHVSIACSVKNRSSKFRMSVLSEKVGDYREALALNLVNAPCTISPYYIIHARYRM